MKHITKLFLTIALLLFCMFTKAQNNDTLDLQRNEKGNIRFARFKLNSNSNRKMNSDTLFLKSILRAKNEDGFRKINEFTDELGIMHKKFQQYYKGIMVENAEYLIHGKNGNIETMNGDFQDINISSTKPSINEQQALAKALLFVGAKKYKWEDEGMEKFAKQNTNNPNATYYPKGELLISKDYLKGSGAFKLSWKFTISSMEPNNEQLIYVDANNGNIINNVPLIYDVNIPCVAQTMYSGNQNITGDTFVGGIRLQENRNGVNIQTLNLHNSYNYAGATDFTNNNANWTNGNWATFNQDQWALDAHWGAEQVLDYWRTVFTRNSIDGNGLRILSYVHVGTSWANAQWVGGQNNNFMQYGDGNSSYMPLTALDVSAHEFGHGITQFTANITWDYTESGALNEGFSDIWAACVEHWAAPNKQTWRIGEELFTATFNCIRDLQNPKSTNTSEGQHPDTYKGSYWNSNGEPHNNSTVLSHWFFLLSQGGAGTNDKGNQYNVTGIGIENAQLIAYRAESLYLNSSATYTDAMNTTIQSARELFGNCSAQATATINAWYAVGLGVGFAPITTVSITARKTSAAGEPTTYEYTATPYLAATYSWYVSGMANNPQQTDLLNVFDWYFPCKTTKSVYCTVSNYCNTATSNSITKTGECRRLNSFVVYPNPATNTVTISTNQNTSTEQTALSATFDEVRIYDQQGNLKKYQKNNKTKQIQIYTSDLNSGVYTVEITDGTYKERQSLIIEK